MIFGILLIFAAFINFVQADVVFAFTSAVQSYIVPANVTSLFVEACGSRGTDSTLAAGKGGCIRCTVTVTSGSTLLVNVGGKNGYNGGGTGTSAGFACNGGGATDIRTTSSLNDRIIVGGGGGGGDCCGVGGAGGGLIGGAGTIATATTGSGGGGGSQTAGGVTSGTFGQGGSGAAGGGGGYYGGGSGNSRGGGGGSSFCSGVITSNLQGTNDGHGQLTIIVVETASPTAVPTAVPTAIPTVIPSAVPSVVPTVEPSFIPTAVPTVRPTGAPSAEPSTEPTSLPSGHPTAQPTAEPTGLPTGKPTSIPTSIPSTVPSSYPSNRPSSIPTSVPTVVPSDFPSSHPTAQPTTLPSGQPTGQPTGHPTAQPTTLPSGQPTIIPTSNPSKWPSGMPTTSPTPKPTAVPSTAAPTIIPTALPTALPTTPDAPHVTAAMQKSTGGLYVDPAYDVSLSGIISSSSLDCTGLWVQTTNGITTSAASAVISAPVVDYKLNYFIPKNTLTPRSAYTFRLICLDIYAVVSFTTNGPPQGGSYSVVPSLGGIEVTTVFAFNVADWNDPDLPLTYQFVYYSTGSSGNISPNMVKSRSIGTTSSTILPAVGVKSTDYAVSTTAFIYDAYYCVVQVDQFVQVNPVPVMSASAASNLVVNQLQNSLNSGDENALTQALTVGSSVLNKVDCSAIADGFCASYNRADCSSVPNTCGACLPLFTIGEYGASNSKCSKPSDLSVPIVVSPSAATGVQPACSTNNPCANPFQQCSLLSGHCEYIPARCLNDCSHHGSCSFIYINSGRPYDGICYKGDLMCKGSCTCNLGFNGYDCSVSDADLDQLKSTREQLLGGLNSLTTSSSPSGDAASTLTVWSENLGSITQNPTELSNSAVDQSLSITSTIVSTLGTVGVGSSDESAVGACLNGVMNTLNSLYSHAEITYSASVGHRQLTVASVVDSSNQLLNDYAAAMVHSRTVGDALIHDNFRMSSADSNSIVGGSDVNISISIPVTAFESMSGIVPSTVSVALGNGLLNLVTISKPVRQYSAVLEANNLTEYSTNPVTVHVGSSSSVGSASLPGRIIFTLQHNELQTLGVIADGFPLPMINSTCVMNQTLTNITRCPNGAIVEQRCDGTMNGVLSTKCPARISVSSCFMLNSQGLPHENCLVIATTAHSTTCSCTFSTRRRLTNGGSAGISEAAAMTTTTYEGFVSTFSVADDLTSLAALSKVMIVIVMFAVVWGGGFILVALSVWSASTQRTLDKVRIADMILKKKQLKQTDMQECVVNYIDRTFPPVFLNSGSINSGNTGRSTAWYSRLWFEIKTKHRYVALLTPMSHDSNNRKKFLMLFQLLSTQTMLMFLLALCYDLQGPSDDGTCVLPENNAEVPCLARKSIWDTSESYCAWVPIDATLNATDMHCVYATHPFTITMVAISALVVALFTAIFNIPLDWMFNLLFAPTADDLKVAEKQKAMIAKISRRMSSASANAAATVRRASTLLTSGLISNGEASRNRRETNLGEVARIIPEHTQEAHDLATLSIEHLSPLFRSHSIFKQENKQKCLLRVDSQRLTVNNLSRFAKPQLLNSHQKALVKFEELCLDINMQRQLLRPSEIQHFDTQWSICLDEQSDLSNYSLGRCQNLVVIGGQDQLTEVEKIVVEQIESASKLATHHIKKLKYARDAHIGLDILHMFVLDLLGRDTPAAKIFAAKSEEDFSYTFVVTRWFKGCLLSAVIGLNLFFVYFAILRSYQRGMSFQRAYLMACIAQFFIEIFIFQTIECAFVNFLIPNLIAEQVTEISHTIKSSLSAVFKAGVSPMVIGANQVTRLNVLDVPQYLFVSTMLAKEHPDLLESHIVSSFSTYLPGELAKQWHKINMHATTSYYYDSFISHQKLHPEHNSGTMITIIKFTVFNFIIGGLLVLGASPMTLQKAVIRLVQPILLAGIVMFAVFISKNVVLSITVGAVAVIVLCYLAYSLHESNRLDTVKANSMNKKIGIAAAVTPVDHEDDDIVDLELDESEDEEWDGRISSSDNSEDWNDSSNGSSSGDSSDCKESEEETNVVVNSLLLSLSGSASMPVDTTVIDSHYSKFDISSSTNTQLGVEANDKDCVSLHEISIEEQASVEEHEKESSDAGISDSLVSSSESDISISDDTDSSSVKDDQLGKLSDSQLDYDSSSKQSISFSLSSHSSSVSHDDDDALWG